MSKSRCQHFRFISKRTFQVQGRLWMRGTLLFLIILLGKFFGLPKLHILMTDICSVFINEMRRSMTYENILNHLTKHLANCKQNCSMDVLIFALIGMNITIITMITFIINFNIFAPGICWFLSGWPASVKEQSLLSESIERMVFRGNCFLDFYYQDYLHFFDYYHRADGPPR